MPSRRRHRATSGLPRARPPVGHARRPTGTAKPPAAPGSARVIIDGRNVQRALERGSAAGSLPTSMLIARVRAALPDAEVELVFDGHAGGGPTGRVAPRFSVAYSRHATADQVIGDRVEEALRALGPAGAWSVLVVSDDREVQAQARRNGARVEGTAWLADRLAAGVRGGTSIGQPRRPRASAEPRLG